jgi:predicted ATP-grasp superfamily ATP-dependent carboligase
MTPQVLVTAGAEKQALAAVRSLGRAGMRVDVLDSKPDAPAFRSKYCRAHFTAPSNLDRDAYAEFLLQRVRAGRYTTVLPCDDVSAGILSAERAQFAPYTTLRLPSVENFRIATDKTELVRFALARGLPAPHTLFPQDRAAANRCAHELGFPLIVKGAHGWGAQHVRMVRAPGDFDAAYDAVVELEKPHGGALPMLQQYVVGTGYGYSTLCRGGEPRAVFLHRRSAEFDVASGAAPYSCPMAESVVDPELEALGSQLFAALRWEGLGMAEWRRETRTGDYYLMEINPRLAGSTDVAMQSGVDLPRLAALLARDGDLDPVRGYPAGVRVRWNLPDGLLDVLAAPRRLLEPAFWSARTDWSWRDPVPHWMQLRRAAWALRQGR